MKSGTYHKQIFFPSVLDDNLHLLDVPLTFTSHALSSCLNDKYGKIIPPRKITVDKNNIIEAEVINDLINKIVLRFPYDDELDLVMVILVNRADFGRVKTLWINRANDTHRTLNRANYVEKSI